MRCNFLSGKYMPVCKVGSRPYIPSDFEIGEYCKTRRHRICPLFCSSQYRKAEDTERAKVVFSSRGESSCVISLEEKR